MGTSEDAELVAQGKSLEQEVATRCPSRSDRSARPDDGSHRLVECRPATPTSNDFWKAQYWRGTAYVKTRKRGMSSANEAGSARFLACSARQSSVGS